jgi:hypothetical protein
MTGLTTKSIPTINPPGRGNSLEASKMDYEPNKRANKPRQDESMNTFAKLLVD